MELFSTLLLLYFVGMGFAMMFGGGPMVGRYNTAIARGLRRVIGGTIMWVGKQIAPPAPKKRRRP